MSNLPAKTKSESQMPAVSASRAPTRALWAAGSTAVAIAGAWTYFYVNGLVGLVLLVLGFVAALRAIPRGKKQLDAKVDAEDGVKKSLGRCRFLEHIGDRGERAYDQYSQANLRHRKLVTLLGEKFSPEELTYGRYHGAIEQAHFGLEANFEKVASHLQAAASTDPTALSRRLKDSTVPNEEKSTLEERLRVREGQLAKADEILGFNEKALLELDRITSALAAIETRRGPNGGVELSAALADLEELSKRAQQYSIK